MSIRTIISAGNRLAGSALFMVMKGGEALTEHEVAVLQEAREAWKVARRSFPDTEPTGWRDFLQMCSECEGGMVNGNRLAMRAKALLADSEANPVAHTFGDEGVANSWSVTVEANGERILCISDQHLAAAPAPEPFAPTIQAIAKQLAAFAGTNVDHLALLDLYQITFDESLSLGDRLQRIASRIQLQGTEAQRTMRREEQQEAATLQSLLLGYFPKHRLPYPNGLFAWATRAIESIQHPYCETAAARDVVSERRHQLLRHGYDYAHDDGQVCEEIAAGAAFYAMPPAAREWSAESCGYGPTFGAAIYPSDWSAPRTGDRRNELVKAGAMIIAEIERLDRATLKAATRSAHD